MNITHKEISVLFKISNTAATRKLSRIKNKLNIKAFQPLSINQVCEFLGWDLEATSKKLGWTEKVEKVRN